MANLSINGATSPGDGPQVRSVAQCACSLGEGPVWIEREQALRFVDIKRGNLHRFDPASGTHETVNVGGNPSFILPETGGSLIVADRSALHLFDGRTMGTPVLRIPQPDTNRTNDATVDPEGRLWFGTMDDAQAVASGEVWCLERGRLLTAGPRAIITNGPAVSVGGKWLYHVDTVQRTIWRFALDDGAPLGSGTVFVELDESEGHPDGVVVDCDDCLWVALWDGWGVRRYSPEGELLLHVSMPCANVTKIAFGGPDLRTAFVTTARVGLTEDALSAQPEAGNLFAFRAPASGHPGFEVRLS